MEMSHRGKEFLSIIQKAESDLRTLLQIPSDYSVLFLHGGATTQFAAVPLNLCNPQDTVDYIVTGSWGDKAFKEAQKYCNPKVIWSGKSEKYTKIPSFDDFEQNPDAKFLHICANETIHGVEFKDVNYPNPKNGILVADMSSNFCSKPVDVSKFGVIYAGAQKNVGPSGVTIVIIRKDLIGNAQSLTPVMLDYKIHDENNSLYNTPPCYGIYMCGLVFEDLLEQGGLKEVEKNNKKKAEILFDAIDGSNGFYRCPVEKSVRSLMNVPFTLEKQELEGEFIKEAARKKWFNLRDIGLLVV
jgi:phosphoserine aminotransferase